VELDGVQEVKVKLDGGPEVNAGQEVELEVDAGPEVNGVQELEVDGGQGLGRGQGVEMNGRQEVNGRHRVGDNVLYIDEYAMGSIRLQSRRNTCRRQVYCLQMGHMQCM
jgi:hypothetical protein